MKTIYIFGTRKGLAQIDFHATTGRFYAVFCNEKLGNYHSPEQAAADLAHGYTFSHSSGIDLTMLGIPEDLEDWERISYDE